MKIPELLTSLSGEKITSKEQWEQFRREECMTLLSNYVYGIPPVDDLKDITYSSKITNENLEGLILKTITITIKGYSFDVYAIYKKSEKPLPTFLYYMHIKECNAYNIEEIPHTPNIPIKDIAERGYAVIVLKFPSVYADNLPDTDYESSLFKVFSPERSKRRDNEWSAIALWSWVSSRIMDYIETDNIFDKNNVAVVGHSRGGKTALWTGATDTRFSFVVSNSSGCMGAAILRDKTGEHLDFITKYTDWFCKNLDRYIDNEDMLPCDQHMLLAAIAPRLLYVESNVLDDWSDPNAERNSAILASEVYKLYGLEGIVVSPQVELEKPYHSGTIGYHICNDDHKIDKFDWDNFIDFWEKHRK